MSIALRPVKMDEDWARLLAWRNDPLTRENFLEGAPVEIPTHLTWLAQTLRDPCIQLYVAHDTSSGQAVGQVRIDRLNASDKKAKTRALTVSLTVDPRVRGRGYAEQVLTALIAKWDLKVGDVLTAKIKATNYASLRAFVTAGFRYRGVTDAVVTMEYHGER